MFYNQLNNIIFIGFTISATFSCFRKAFVLPQVLVCVGRENILWKLFPLISRSNAAQPSPKLLNFKKCPIPPPIATACRNHSLNTITQECCNQSLFSLKFYFAALKNYVEELWDQSC